MSADLVDNLVAACWAGVAVFGILFLYELFFGKEPTR